MQSLALICMLLTVGTIVVPRGDRGVDGLVAVIAKQAQDYAAQRSSINIARLEDSASADLSLTERTLRGWVVLEPQLCNFYY